MTQEPSRPLNPKVIVAIAALTLILVIAIYVGVQLPTDCPECPQCPEPAAAPVEPAN